MKCTLSCCFEQVWQLLQMSNIKLPRGRNSSPRHKGKGKEIHRAIEDSSKEAEKEESNDNRQNLSDVTILCLDPTLAYNCQELWT